jgi:hypothetical protein
MPQAHGAHDVNRRGRGGTVAAMVTGVIDDVQWISDEELAAEALAADPEAALDDDALPFGADGEGDDGFSLLPQWYMPAPGRSRRPNIAAWVVLLIVGSLLLAEAFGFCLTNGRPELPF